MSVWKNLSGPDRALWGIAAVILLGFTYLAYHRYFDPFWYDEVFTAGVTAPPVSEGLHLILAEPHPPLYNALVAIAHAIIGPGKAPLLQLLNLIGVGAMAVGLVRIGRHWGVASAAFATILTFANAYTLSLLFDLRSYFLVMAGSYLMFCLALVGPTSRSTGWARGVAVAIGFTHFFGTAIACALMGWLGLRRWLEGDRVAARRYAVTVGIIVLLFAIWTYQGRATYQRFAADGFWIELTVDHYRRLAVWAEIVTLMLVVLGVWALAVRRGSVVVVDTLMPALIVLLGTYALSLVQPLVTGRNLAVVVPPAILACTALFHRIGNRWALVAVLAVLAPICLIRSDDSPLKPQENVDFIAARAFTEDCTDLPLFAAQIWAGFDETARAYDRPSRALSKDIEAVAQAHLALTDHPCDIVGILAWVTPTPEEAAARFAAAGLPVVIEGSPATRNVVANASYVIRRAPD